jgi:hypothetical protein
MYIGTGLLFWRFPYKTVKDIERIEQKMRIDLPLEFMVALLGDMLLLLFCLHLIAC